MPVTQIHGEKQIQDLTIKNAQIASDAAIELSKLEESVIQADGGQAFTGDQSMGSNRLTNVADPTAAQDAATKAYVDGVATGLDLKDSVRVATTAAGTLATSFANGQTVDGVTLATGDRILIKDQADGSENGIYVVEASGAPTRATDADADAEVTSGMFCFVEEGTTNDNSGWVLTTNDPITVGTTALSFSQFSDSGQVIAGDGLVKTGSTIDVVAGDASLTVTADSIYVAYDSTASTIALGDDGIKVADGDAGQILVGQGVGTETTFQTVSGDATLAADGTFTVSGDFAKNADFVDRETPSGSVDGTNAAFTLAQTPVSGSEHVYLNGLLQEDGGSEDYTISGGTITFNEAPQSGSRVRVSYRYNS